MKRPPIDELNKAIYAVYFDEINGVPGTDYPIGTATMPVNNFTDAKAIALARKTSTIILVHGIITLTGETESALADVTTDQLVYTKVAEVILTEDHPALSVSFDLATDGATAFGQIWVNDVDVGIEQTDPPGGTFLEILSGGFVAGDKIQIYAKTDDALQLAHVSNFIVRGTISGYNFIGNKFSDPAGALLDNVIQLNGFTAFDCAFEGINIQDDAGGSLSNCGYFIDCASVRGETIENCSHFINCAIIFTNNMTLCNYFLSCSQIIATMSNCSCFLSCGQINGSKYDCTKFLNCQEITGSLTSCSDFYSCGKVSGTMISCTDFWDCGEASIDYDCTGLGTNPTLSFKSGLLFIEKLTAAVTFTISGDSLRVTIDPTCTAGTIKVYGNAKITGKEAAIAAGVTIEDYTNNPNDEVPVDVMAVVSPGTTIFDLSAADTHYTVDKLGLVPDEPGGDTITAELWGLVNGVLTLIRSFVMGGGSGGVYFSLLDMFALDHLYGDNLKIVVVASANTYAVTGSYVYRSA